MSWQLNHLLPDAKDTAVNSAMLDAALDRLITVQRPHHRRLWVYYRNPLRVQSPRNADHGSDRPYRQGQEWGLPSRITGAQVSRDIDAPVTPIEQVARKEVVIENDIAWRIDTGVDYLFGRPLPFESTAPDPDRRATITALLKLILDQHGGILFLQQLALLGSVHGFVDCLVKFRADLAPAPTALHADPRVTDTLALEQLAKTIRLEIVEPSRALPLLDPADVRHLLAYGQACELPQPPQAQAGRSSPARARSGIRRWLGALTASTSNAPLNRPGHEDRQIVELITPDRWQRYHDQTLVAAGVNTLGEIPLVHIQNVPQPFEYAGAGDVEPLIPLQDELNIRLCDRAHRITLQSFKMYLAKGVDNFLDQPVSPGRMWLTSRDDADVIEFGGDSNCPSEDAHLTDIREALDKTSGVTPIAAGAIKNRIGRLTSGAALRITLLALLSKTDRKRTTYGAGLARLCDLSLRWLDQTGLFRTDPGERGIELHWSSPLPENDMEKLDEAAAKLRVGISRSTVLRELGYDAD